MSAAFIIISLLFPAGIIYLTYKYEFLNRIGAVILCYTGGIIVGNTGLFPGSITSLQSSISEITVAVSLPLLSGITTGIIGYAIGNYLGISLALLLH